MIVLQHPDFFIPNELTISQLKNAGGMRLINAKSSVDVIYKYDISKNLLSNQQVYYEDYQNKVIDLGLKVFKQYQLLEVGACLKTKNTLKLKTMNLDLIQGDKNTITELGNRVSMYSGIVNYYTMLLEETRQQADTLIFRLVENYKLSES